MVKATQEAGLAALVRVNHDLLMLADDLRCLVNAGADGFVFPKANSPSVWPLIDQALHDLQAPHLPALALLGHPLAFAASVGAPPSSALLMPVAQHKAAFAIPASIVDLHDMATWEQAANQARAWGADGGLCIHPKQVAVLERVFAPQKNGFGHEPLLRPVSNNPSKAF